MLVWGLVLRSVFQSKAFPSLAGSEALVPSDPEDGGMHSAAVATSPRHAARASPLDQRYSIGSL